MASSLPAYLFLLVFWQFVAAADPVSVTTKAGADVILPCKTAGNKTVVKAEWSRLEQPSAPVLFYKNKKVDYNQLSAYKGRTSLLNVKKGDLSLVLKKALGRDAGKYECRVELWTGITPEKEDEDEEGEGETPPVRRGDRGGGSSGRSGIILKSGPISNVTLIVEGGSSHRGDSLRPKSVLPVGLLALLVLIAVLQ